uniref:Uncharacterized protein n=1 Tax=Rhizophora mucronata TaxID=61149 RepID=A0A2P2N119_RHIMU
MECRNWEFSVDSSLLRLSKGILHEEIFLSLPPKPKAANICVYSQKGLTNVRYLNSNIILEHFHPHHRVI